MNIVDKLAYMFCVLKSYFSLNVYCAYDNLVFVNINGISHFKQKTEVIKSVIKVFKRRAQGARIPFTNLLLKLVSI